MSIASETSYVEYAGDDSTTARSVTFRYDDSSWLKVTETDGDGDVTTLSEGADFTLSGDGSTASATLTLTTATATGTTLRIERNTPPLQSLDLTYNSSLPSTGLEAALDRVVMMMQDHDRRIDDKIGALVTNESISSGSYATSFGWAVGSSYAEATFGGVGGLTVTGAALTGKGAGTYVITINCVDAGESIIISADGSVSIGSTIAANFRTALGL